MAIQLSNIAPNLIKNNGGNTPLRGVGATLHLKQGWKLRFIGAEKSGGASATVAHWAKVKDDKVNYSHSYMVAVNLSAIVDKLEAAVFFKEYAMLDREANGEKSCFRSEHIDAANTFIAGHSQAAIDAAYSAIEEKDVQIVGGVQAYDNIR